MAETSSSLPLNYLSAAAAYPLFFVSLVSFGVLALIANLYYSKNFLHPTDAFLLSNRSHGWPSISLSIYSTCIGNWVLFVPASIGALYSWPGVIGYTVSFGCPFVLLAWIGPKIKHFMSDRGFASTDHILHHYGRLSHLLFSSIAMLGMFVILASELTTIGMTMTLLSNDSFNLYAALIPVAIVTLAYTTVGGLSVSIATDFAQGIIIIFFSTLLAIVACSTHSISREGWAKATTVSPTSAYACFSLILSVYPSILLDQGLWQRVCASRSDRDLRLGILTGGLLSTFTICLLTLCGMVANAVIITADGAPLENSSIVLMRILSSLDKGWLYLVVILAVASVSSSVDTYQNAIVSVIGHDLRERNLSFNWARLAAVILNIPAILLASLQIDVLNLFMLANALCAIVAGPFIMSLYPYTTGVAALTGSFISFLAALTVGWIDSRSFTGGFTFLLPQDLATPAYVIMFAILTPIGAGVTALVSYLQWRFGTDEIRDRVSRETERMRSANLESMVFDASARAKANKHSMDASVNGSGESEMESIAHVRLNPEEKSTGTSKSASEVFRIATGTLGDGSEEKAWN